MTHTNQPLNQYAPQGFISPHELTKMPPQTPILVGFSGGADSTLLLYLLSMYGKIHGTPIYAAHLHHGIRGAEADRDLAFCQQTAEDLGIPLMVDYADIPARSAVSGRSLELEARLARYAFFEKCMREHHIPLLAVAHHANDQLETLLMRFLRGSGTRGMGGIHPVRPFGEGLIIRPLLACAKEDIVSCCHDLNISYVTDSTNEADDATRNRLRHHLIPLMQSLTEHGTPTTAALRLSAHAREDEDFIMTCAKDAMSQCVTESKLCLDTFKTLHPAVGKRILSLLFEAVTDSADGKHTLASHHIDTLWTFATKAQSGQCLHLPGQTKAIVSQGFLQFLPPNVTNQSPSLPQRLSMGVTSFDGGRIGIHLSMDTPPDIPQANIIAQATFPTTVLPLTARTREAGDIIFSHGMHKKLKKLLCDKNIPLDMRDRLPLICYGEECTPLWYPNVAFADGFPPPASNSLIITIFEQIPSKGTNI